MRACEATSHDRQTEISLPSHDFFGVYAINTEEVAECYRPSEMMPTLRFPPLLPGISAALFNSAR